MSSNTDPLPAVPAAGILQYKTDSTYVPAGTATPGAVIQALVAGLAAAALGAVLAAAYLWNGLPLALFVPVGQGLLVGIVLGRICRRAKLANAGVAVTIGAICGIVSAVLFFFSSYLLIVNDLHRRAAQIAAQITVSAPSRFETYHAFVRDHPFAAYDQFFTVPRVHHGGFAGYLLTRPSHAWMYAAIQILAVPLIAAKTVNKRVSGPFCRSCGRWFEPPVNISVLPIDFADALVRVIETADVAQATELARFEDAPMEAGCAVARLYACKTCGEQFVDVQVLSGKYRSIRLSLTRAGTELVQALKGGPGAVTSQDSVPTATALQPTESSTENQ